MTSSTEPTRFDVYGTIHKALRALMSDTLVRVGRMDTTDAGELESVCVQVEGLLDTMRDHLAHEDEFIHPAMDAAVPGSTRRIEGEHVQHREAIAGLVADLAAVRRDPSSRTALQLYRHLALFVAENLQHMDVEETAHHALLWQHFTDAQLAEMVGRLQASIAPETMGALLRWMLPAMDPAQRAGMLIDMRWHLPPPAFGGVLEIAKAHLDDSGWRKLSRDLSLAPEPAEA
jgi:hemerythrin-like domain-containing protein